MPQRKFVPCTPPPPPSVADTELSQIACSINPANAPDLSGIESLYMVAIQAAPGLEQLALPPKPQFIAMSTTRFWGPTQRKFGVSFLDSTGPTTRNLILSHLNAWSDYCGVSFLESSQGEIRITRGPGGYWSYLGTDILSIPSGKPTMNLEGFTERTSDSEYRRVVRHEAGHTLGCPHEHLRKEIIGRIDPAKAIAYFREFSGWPATTVMQQVLTPIEDSSIMGTATAEQDSIMTYSFPKEITKDRKPIVGGKDITPSDGAFLGKLIPKVDIPIIPPIEPPKPIQTATMPVFASTKLATAWLETLGHRVENGSMGQSELLMLYAETEKVIEAMKNMGFKIAI